MEHYQKIQQKYNKEVADIFKGNIVVEEKVDGSQFRVEIDTDGTIRCASKNIELNMADSNFKLATEQAEHIFAGFKPQQKTTVFCEYLKSVKHNTLAYERVPKNNLVLFDVKVGDKYLERRTKEWFANGFMMEITPVLYEGDGNTITQETIDGWLKTTSFLGKAIIEGVVIKAYNRFYDINLYPYLQGHWLCCKIVRPEFREVNGENKVTKKEELEKIKEKYTTTARFDKAIQHCTELGQVTNQMSDLKFLFSEVQNDIIAEEKENIKEDLWKAFSNDILRASTNGLVEYYKNKLQGVQA